MAYDRDVWVEIDKAKLINNYSEIRLHRPEGQRGRHGRSQRGKGS